MRISALDAPQPEHRVHALYHVHVSQRTSIPPPTHPPHLKDARQQPLHHLRTPQCVRNVNTQHTHTTRHIYASHHGTVDTSQHVPSSPCLCLNTYRVYTLTRSILHHGCPSTHISQCIHILILHHIHKCTLPKSPCLHRCHILFGAHLTSGQFPTEGGSMSGTPTNELPSAFP